MRKRRIAILLLALGLLLTTAACTKSINNTDGNPVGVLGNEAVSASVGDSANTPGGETTHDPAGNVVDVPAENKPGEAPTGIAGIPEPSIMDIDALFNPENMPDIADVPVASLGEYTVLRSDYAFFFYQLRENIQYSVGAVGLLEDERAFFWDSAFDQSGTTAREYLKTNAMKAAMEMVIIYNQALKSGTEPDEDRNRQSDMNVLSNLSQLNSNEKEFADFFQMTSKQLREANYRMNLILKFRQETLSTFTVAEADIRAAFDGSPEYYDAVMVRHVFISCTDEMSPEMRDAAKSTADEVQQLLEEGADFGELAYYYSNDPLSQNQNGERTFTRGEMAAEFENWAYAAKEGDRTLIKTDLGYHVAELLIPAGYEYAKEEIEYDIRSGMFNKSMENELALINSPDWVLNQEVLDSIVA